MPFKSKAQMRYLYSQEPEVAQRWASRYGTKNLPERKIKRQKKRRKKV
jgi:hypothetical protein